MCGLISYDDDIVYKIRTILLISRSTVTLQHAGCSVTGLVRSNNEDAWLGDAGLGLFVVADGMGGYQSGELASALTVQTMRDRVAAGDDLVAAPNAAQSRLIEAAEQGLGDASMGTTMVAIRLHDRRYELAWVGDSRAYLWRADALHQLSRDHSYVQTLVDQRIITARQAQLHPQRNLLSRCLSGGQFATPEIDLLTGRLQVDDVLLLCSDGLSNELTDLEIAQLLHDHTDAALPELARQLVTAAETGGGRDNVPVLLIKLAR